MMIDDRASEYISLAIFGLLALSILIDRKACEKSPLTPLTAVMLVIALKAGLAPILMNTTGAQQIAYSKYAIMTQYKSQTQLLWLIFSVVFLGTFWAWGHFCKKNWISKEQYINRKALIQLCIGTGIFTLIWISIGALTGSSSRNAVDYAMWVKRFWKPDSFFTAFGRLRDIFIYLTPLTVVKCKNLAIRSILVIILGVYMLTAYSVGGRGIVLIPMVVLFFGYIMTKPRAMLIIISLSIVIAVGMYGTIALEGDHSRRGDMLQVKDNSAAQSLTKIGTSLYGCSDAYNFTEENKKKAGAGFVRAERWLTAWVPSAVSGNAKKSARDSHMIAEELEGSSRETAEKKDYGSFNCVTYVGDLYWRWRWTGVVAGSLVFCICYRFISSYWYKNGGFERISSIYLLAFPATFISLFPVGSIGETFWLWTWDIVKYMLIYWVLVFSEKVRG